MRANRLALVFADVNLGLPLAREDVEVVEPEVDEHFFELTLAVHRAQQLRLGELGEDLPRAPDGIVVHPAAATVGWLILCSAGLLAATRSCRAGDEVLAATVSGSSVSVVNRSSRASSSGVGDAFGPKLLIDPGGEPIA